MDATTVVAIAGITGTLLGSFGGPYVQARLKQKGDQKAKLNDTRAALYLEAMDFAEREEAWLDHIQTPYASKRTFPDVPMEEKITSKMRLFAAENVTADWNKLRKARADLAWDLTEIEPELTLTEQGVPDIPELIAVRDAITMLRQSLREALGTPDD